MKNMRAKDKDSPFAKEVKRLHARGKAPDIIALRLGVKMSKVLAAIHPSGAAET